MSFVIVAFLVLVLAALGSAGVFMLRRKDLRADPHEADRRMARALAVRVALSVTLFLLILIAWRMGWIQPKGLPVGT